jgi:hypothetical protein
MDDPVNVAELHRDAVQKLSKIDQMLEYSHTGTGSKSLEKMRAKLKGAQVRHGNRKAASQATDELHDQINEKHELWTQIKDDDGRTDFQRKDDERNQRANDIGAFWSASIKDTQKEPDPKLSGEYLAEKQAANKGRMMAQTDLHKGAIEYIREKLTEVAISERRLRQSVEGDELYLADEAQRLPADAYQKIQKDPENNLVYTHFRSSPTDVFFAAWGSSSEEFATGLGHNMVPTNTNGAQIHRKFDDTVQIKYELPAFVKSATELKGSLDQAARLNQIAALGDQQLFQEEDNRNERINAPGKKQSELANSLGDTQMATRQIQLEQRQADTTSKQEALLKTLADVSRFEGHSNHMEYVQTNLDYLKDIVKNGPGREQEIGFALERLRSVVEPPGLVDALYSAQISALLASVKAQDEVAQKLQEESKKPSSADPSASELWKQGVDAQDFDVEKYRSLNPAERPEGGAFWSMKREDQKNKAQQEFTEEYDERSYAGTGQMHEGREKATKTLNSLRASKKADDEYKEEMGKT